MPSVGLHLLAMAFFVGDQILLVVAGTVYTPRVEEDGMACYFLVVV